MQNTREVTDEQLEQFLLHGHGLVSQHGLSSHNGSFATVDVPRTDAAAATAGTDTETAATSAHGSPTRSPWRRSTVDLNATLHDAESLIQQLSSAADAEDAVAAAVAAAARSNSASAGAADTDGEKRGGSAADVEAGPGLAQEATFGAVLE